MKRRIIEGVIIALLVGSVTTTFVTLGRISGLIATVDAMRNDVQVIQRYVLTSNGRLLVLEAKLGNVEENIRNHKHDGPIVQIGEPPIDPNPVVEVLDYVDDYPRKVGRELRKAIKKVERESSNVLKKVGTAIGIK